MHLERGGEPSEEQYDPVFAPEEEAQASGVQQDVTDTEVASDQDQQDAPTEEPTVEPPTIFPGLIPPRQPQQKKRPAPKHNDEEPPTFGAEQGEPVSPQGSSRESRSNEISNIQNLVRFPCSWTAPNPDLSMTLTSSSQKEALIGSEGLSPCLEAPRALRSSVSWHNATEE